MKVALRLSPKCIPAARGRTRAPATVTVIPTQEKGEPEFYAAGSEGPEGADDLLARDGRKWLPLNTNK